MLTEKKYIMPNRESTEPMYRESLTQLGDVPRNTRVVEQPNLYEYESLACVICCSTMNVENQMVSRWLRLPFRQFVCKDMEYTATCLATIRTPSTSLRNYFVCCRKSPKTYLPRLK